jgi:hypothetical protein
MITSASNWEHSINDIGKIKSKDSKKAPEKLVRSSHSPKTCSKLLDRTIDWSKSAPMLDKLKSLQMSNMKSGRNTYGLTLPKMKEPSWKSTLNN